MHDSTCDFGGCTSSVSSSWRTPASMPLISGEWKAWLTSSRDAFSPCSATRAAAASMPWVVPESTTWVGWLRFATQTPSRP